MMHGCAYMYIHFQEKALKKKNYDKFGVVKRSQFSFAGTLVV